MGDVHLHVQFFKDCLRNAADDEHDGRPHGRKIDHILAAPDRLEDAAGDGVGVRKERIAAEVPPTPELAELLEFIAQSERGFVK